MQNGIINRARTLRPRQHIVLISHMRAYTTLFGHILGSSPEICGYYEMHIGYYSWKSLYRQRLLYFKDEAFKPDFRYMFDKVLHNEHRVDRSVLEMSAVKPIFSLRQPEDTISSIVRIYRENEPDHEFCSPDVCCSYYIERLSAIRQMAAAASTSGYFYLDAAALKQQTEPCLRALEQWLGLKTPLQQNYQIQQRTSKTIYGDSSRNIGSGKIVRDAIEPDPVAVNATGLEDARRLYRQTREELAADAEKAVLITPD